MPDTPTKTPARVPYSFLEYRVEYEEPFFELQKLYSQIAAGIFQAYKEWNVRLENITFKQNPSNLAEVSLSVAFPGGRYVFNAGLAGASFNVSNPYWEEADAVLKAAETGISAVRSAMGISVKLQRVVLGVHLQAITGLIADRVGELVRVDHNLLSGKGGRGFGISVYKEDLAWVIDTSAQYPGGLFVKIDRLFEPKVSLSEIASLLNHDEKKLFELLSVEVG
jgi:hypothetical protein